MTETPPGFFVYQWLARGIAAISSLLRRLVVASDEVKRRKNGINGLVDALAVVESKMSGLGMKKHSILRLSAPLDSLRNTGSIKSIDDLHCCLLKV